MRLKLLQINQADRDELPSIEPDMPFQMASSNDEFEQLKMVKREKFQEVAPISGDGDAKLIPQTGEQQQNKINRGDMRELMI